MTPFFNALLLLLVFVVMVVTFSVLIRPLREIRVALLEQRYRFLSVCVVFMCPNNGTAASVWDS